MLRNLLKIFLVVFINILQADHDPYQLAVTTGEPSANIANAVNAITGDYYISETELMVQGMEPIVIHPTYISKSGQLKWFLFNHLNIRVEQLINYRVMHLDKKIISRGPEMFAVEMASITEPSGANLYYSCEMVGNPKELKKGGWLHSSKEKEHLKQNNENRKEFNKYTYLPLILLEDSYKKGLSNCSLSEINGRLNLKNHDVFNLV